MVIIYKKMREHYEKNLKCYGVGDERSLGWTKHKQAIRFEHLLHYWNMENSSLLDVGCGFGDLYQYLRHEGKNETIDYFGIDIMPQFIDAAGKLTGEPERFSCQDILSMENETFDYVVAAGIFGYKVYDDERDNYVHIDRVMKKALELCREGVSMCFLSDKTDYHTSGDDFHASPEKILKLAYQYSRNVILDNSVMPFEFFLTIFKDDSFKAETTIFERYLKNACSHGNQ